MVLIMRSAAANLRWAFVVLVVVLGTFGGGGEAAAAGGGRVRHHKWEVKYEYKSPDCYEKLVITINGGSPGPTIVAQKGDTVIVELKNSLGTENVAVHWHGIRQIGTPWSDGTEGVTQCPILPGDTFIYKFVVDRPGTYLYHAHYGMQREAGLYGLIKVSVPDGEVEPFAYDGGDHSMILNDWYHKSAYEQATGLASKPFVWVGEPQSLLINNKGRYNCSLVSSTTKNAAGSGSICNTTNPQCSPHTITVVPRRTYRLRIASITALSALSFEIQGHNMTVVEADGHYVEPFITKTLFIYSGETYSVLLTANQPSTTNYWITTNVVSRKPATPTGLAVLNYYPNHPKRSPPTIPPAGPTWNDTAIRVSQSLAIKAHRNYILTPPQKSNRTIFLLNTQNKVDGFTRWSVNNISFFLPHKPYLLALTNPNIKHTFNHIPAPDTISMVNYDIRKPPVNPNASLSDSIYRLELGSVVDVVLQNANSLTVNNSETHPWHLHGHDFWVLGFGDGLFDPVKDGGKLNLKDPIMKNTVPLFQYGWTVIRFKADNPGVWFFHCHVEAHLALGMGVVFEEGVEKLGKLPRAMMGCGQAN